MLTLTRPRAPEPPEAGPQARRSLRARPRGGDAVFLRSTRGAALVAVAIMVLIGLFLALKAGHAIGDAKLHFLTQAQWEPDAHRFGIKAIILGTVLIAAVAIVVAVPFALATALFISEVAPAPLKRLLIPIVDLMAAIPSVVYGLWGLYYLEGHLVGVARWINAWFGWVPLFHVAGAKPHDPLSSASVYSASTFIAGLVVAMMVMPITCAIMREAYSQAPPGEREGAYALGATRWGMIRTVVLPFGRGAAIGGTMLGLGRALGETIAVALIISPEYRVQPHILQTGASSVASLIATRFGEASPLALSALFAAGLALFALTIGINFGASAVISRSRSGALSEA